ncbi:hypothetical protein PPERSA_04879 [Pseudocohnilembus persalinus]|uniref:Transmembrane protein n=1 Tax=Pseudocohnilembus persalinus TaxID=266149 RepID=A0A0V0QIX2_PSEPJ|nr:hypothetical protein PPERSA_04879 [Pseudocohnilembus persalinus]|eukprot:KRX02257.1 hypothetical protein PPERSA_04879 [Pseudocohnilembus persalinus]
MRLIIIILIILIAQIQKSYNLEQSRRQEASIVFEKACDGLIYENGKLVSQEQINQAEKNFDYIQNNYRDGRNQLREDVLEQRNNRELKILMKEYAFDLIDDVKIFIVLAGEPCCPCIKGCPQRYNQYCPPWKNCFKFCRKHQFLYKNEFEMKMYKGWSLLWPFIGITIIMIAIITISIIGIIHSKNLYQSYNSLHCTGIKSMFVAAYGNKDWVGINKLGNKLLNLGDDLDPLIQLSLETFYNSKWMSNGLQDINDKTQQLVEDRDYYMYNNNPLDGEFENNNAQYDYNKPLFQNMFEEEQPSTFFGNEFSPFYYIYSNDKFAQSVNDTINPLAENMKKIETLGISLAEDGEAAKISINKGKDLINKYLKNLNEFYFDLNKNFEDSEPYAKSIGYVTMGLHIFFLTTAIFIFVPMAFMVFKNIYKLRYVLHFYWIIYGFFSFIGFMLLTILIGGGIMGSESCRILNKFLNDEQEFQSYPDFIDPSITNNLMVCKSQLGGDGEILEYYNIQDYLLMIEDIQLRMEEHFDYDENEIGYENINYPEHLSLVQALTNLNTEINNSCDESDQWVKSIQDCQTNVSNDLYSLSGQCYWIGGTTLSDDSQYFLTENEISSANRYSECPQAASYLENILLWRSDKITIFDNKYNQTEELKSSIEDYVLYIDDFTSNITSFYNQTYGILNQVTDKQDGILVDINCLFVGQIMDDFYNAVCDSFFSNLITQAEIIIYMSVSLFLAQFLIYLVNMKFSWNRYIQKIHRKNIALKKDDIELKEINTKNDEKSLNNCKQNIKPQNQKQNSKNSSRCYKKLNQPLAFQDHNNNSFAQTNHNPTTQNNFDEDLQNKCNKNRIKYLRDSNQSSLNQSMNQENDNQDKNCIKIDQNQTMSQQNVKNQNKIQKNQNLLDSRTFPIIKEQIKDEQKN